jgi:hypothetical protein
MTRDAKSYRRIIGIKVQKGFGTLKNVEVKFLNIYAHFFYHRPIMHSGDFPAIHFRIPLKGLLRGVTALSHDFTPPNMT